jgi:hypothetical protein
VLLAGVGLPPVRASLAPLKRIESTGLGVPLRNGCAKLGHQRAVRNLSAAFPFSFTEVPGRFA